MKKNFLFGLLAIALATFSFGGVSLADCVAKIGEECYSTLAESLQHASSGETIKLETDLGNDTDDIDIANYNNTVGYMKNKSITIDLNNHTIKRLYFLLVDGSLTIKGSGVIIGQPKYPAFTVAPKEGESHLVIGDGVKIIAGSDNTSDSDDSAIIVNHDNNSGISSVILLEGAKLVGENGIAVFGSDEDDKVAKNITVNVNGTIEATNVGLSTNGIIRDNSGYPIFNIGENANISSQSVGIYQAGYSEFNISSGAQIEGDESAMEIRAGKLNIQGGVFISNANTFSENPNGNGSTMVGVALAVSQHSTNQNINVTINGGTFIGIKAFHEKDIQTEPAEGIVAEINGGIFSGDVSSQNVPNLIKGGIFSSEPTAYVYEGYTVLEKDGKYHVMSLAAAATDASNTGNIQLPEGVTIDTGNGPVIMDLSDDITDYLSGSINTSVTIEEAVLTGEIQDAGHHDASIKGTVFLDFGNTGAKFSRPVAIRIPVSGVTSVKVKVKHGTDAYGYAGLTTNPNATCDDGNVTSYAYTGELIPVVGNYVVIYTCSASTFVAYTETQNQTQSYGGGGGGSSSTSYSCKNLPDNAVANNTSKPKSNTNYSYSTDTGAVCTFQCKTGYTRNEKTSACDKTDTTVEDTGSVNTDDTDNTTTEDLQKILDDGFTVEFHYAYDFAFANGITTMKTIKEAAMNDGLTRIAMAKMLSQYAINVLKKTPDTSKECKFSDVSEELDAQYDHGVTLACQLGIMGVGITEFRPDDLVVRAEFGTALSRLLFGLADGEDAYYTTHLAKLKAEGIISNDDPSLEELRGYVMLMLMRSAK